MAPTAAQKRKLKDFLEADSSPAVTEAKRAKLAMLTSEELVDRVFALEAEVVLLNDPHPQEPGNSQQAKTTQTDANTGDASNAEWSEEKIQASVLKLQETINREVKKQMKWQPSCKQGTTKWSYTSGVANETVFFKALGLPAKDAKGKKWKQKKIPTREFRNAVGHIQASCRYNHLGITSESVNVKWNEEDRMFTVSGTYGI